MMSTNAAPLWGLTPHNSNENDIIVQIQPLSDDECHPEDECGRAYKSAQIKGINGTTPSLEASVSSVDAMPSPLTSSGMDSTLLNSPSPMEASSADIQNASVLKTAVLTESLQNNIPGQYNNLASETL